MSVFKCDPHWKHDPNQNEPDSIPKYCHHINDTVNDDILVPREMINAKQSQFTTTQHSVVCGEYRDSLLRHLI